MAISLNGWPVIPSGGSGLRRIRVPGTKRDLTLQKEVAPLMAALAHDYHSWLAPIDVGTFDDAGYCNRDARLSPGKKSNHASGTAMDLNWSKEGAQNSAAGAKFFSNVKNRLAVARIKAIYGGCIQWGGDWNARDYMHWEIKPGVGVGKVRELTKKLGIDEDGVRTKNRLGQKISPRR